MTTRFLHHGPRNDVLVDMGDVAAAAGEPHPLILQSVSGGAKVDRAGPRTDSRHTPIAHPTLALVWFITELEYRGVGSG